MLSSQLNFKFYFYCMWTSVCTFTLGPSHTGRFCSTEVASFLPQLTARDPSLCNCPCVTWSELHSSSEKEPASNTGLGVLATWLWLTPLLATWLLSPLPWALAGFHLQPALEPRCWDFPNSNDSRTAILVVSVVLIMGQVLPQVLYAHDFYSFTPTLEDRYYL